MRGRLKPGVLPHPRDRGTRERPRGLRAAAGGGWRPGPRGGGARGPGGPVMATPERLDRSYEQLAADRMVPVALVQALHQALGFAPPDPADRAGEDDITMLDVAELFRGAGVGDEATSRLLAVYADSIRRIAKAEADYYETN